MEALAAVTLLRERIPDLRIRVVNVVDLMTLQPTRNIRMALPDEEYDQIFRRTCRSIFAFHGYPWVIHRLTYRRHNHDNIHVRGYKEEGTTTTPFDMCVLNNIDRFQLTLDAIQRVPRLKSASGCGRAVVLRRDSASQAVCGRERRRFARGKELALAGKRIREQAASEELAGVAPGRHLQARNLMQVSSRVMHSRSAPQTALNLIRIHAQLAV